MSNEGPLSGLTVVDMTRVLAGPTSTMMLADLGARVIKVERPGRGDDTRQFGPPFLKDEEGDDTSEAAYYLSTNRGKESLTLDFAQSEGRKIARALAAKADILVENYKVGNLAKYGLGYDDLRHDHPGLIYCSITGFGQTGPYSSRAGYDFLIQAVGGLMSITGNPDGTPGGGPLRVGIPISDLLTGLYATIAILAALAHRQNTGKGQYIDISLLDSTVATLSYQAMNFLTTGEEPGRIGNVHPNIVPYQVFATADGNVVVAVGNDAQFVRFCEVIGMVELPLDPRFENNMERVRNRDQLVPLLAGTMVRRSSQEWMEVMDPAGLSCGPINSLEEVLSHPQVVARDMKIEMPHPLSGTVTLVGSPLKLSESPVSYRLAPPLLGEHSDAILDELGYSAVDIEALRKDGVV
jgi:crotonobetainyl-CoA:carnitine CoA-transferase CaiB-like acyl-CoA transferase